MDLYKNVPPSGGVRNIGPIYFPARFVGGVLPLETRGRGNIEC